MKKSYRLIITSGPTREFIDPVRFISNPSTGKMGYYIAEVALQNIELWQDVIYICGAALPNYSKVEGCKNISVESTEEMSQAVLKSMQDNCVLIMAAAPADYQVVQKSLYKLKKKKNPSIELQPTPDILLAVKEKKEKENLQNFFAIGFAAETDHFKENAKKKLSEKNLTMIFLNDVTKKDSGFASDNNQITMIQKDGTQIFWQQDSKKNLAKKILKEISKWLLELSFPSTTKPMN